jgi:hypothetical protein
MRETFTSQLPVIMKSKNHPVPSKAQRELRRYEDRWLPPFSTGSLLGMTLFFLFIGSAIRSILTASNIAGLGAAYKERMEERAFCRSFQSQFLPITPWKPACTGFLFKNYNRNNLSTVPTVDMDSDSPTSTERKKYLFMQPYGGLGSRLRAVASAMSLAAEVGAEPVIVWRNSEFGYTGAWHDLFRAPELPLGCFPGEALREETAKCKVHTVNSRADWLDIKNTWETMTLQSSTKDTGGAATNDTANIAATKSEIDVLCLKSLMYLSDKQRELKRFYQLLQPAETIQHQIDTFMSTVQWNDSATTWVGVHSRRTDLKLRCTSEKCREGVTVQEALPLSEFTRLMNQVAGVAPKNTKIRFYLATDDPEAEEEMKRQLAHDVETRAALLLQSASSNNGMGLIGGSGRSANAKTPSSLQIPPVIDTPSQTSILKTMVGTSTSTEAAAGDFSEMSLLPIVVSMPKTTRDASKKSSQQWLETRSVVSGLQEAVADLYMLSRTQILIGTVGSTFSQTAKLMGDAFFLTAGAHLELRN